MKRIISMLLVTLLIFSSTACSKKDAVVDQGQDNTDNKDTEVSSTQIGNIIERSKGVTNRQYISTTPATLNEHDIDTADSNAITDYTTIGFYDIVAAEEGSDQEFTFICEMAEEFPIDITEKYAGNETYGIPADVKENYAYLIKLNKNAKWEDGKPITADDYIYSYSQLINPEMKNIRASELYEGYLSLANAERYYKQGITYEDAVDNEDAEGVADSELYFSMTEPVYFFDDPCEAYYDDKEYKDNFISADGRDLFKLYSNEQYVKLTPQAIKDLTEIAANFDETDEGVYREFCFVRNDIPPMDFSEVGMKKVSDYEIEFILNAPTDDFFMKYTLTTNWLVREELYEDNKVQTGDIIKTAYGNDMDTYMSYGPYKITEYIKGKLAILKMNENWYGWTDGNHEFYSNYETLRYDVIPESETAFQMFLQGKLENAPISSGKEEYASSDYLFVSPNKWTYCLNFYCDTENLKEMQGEGENKAILGYKDFRQAISIGLNRVSFCKALGPLRQPINVLLNQIYITDPYAGTSYRASEYGKQVQIDLYGGTDVDSGYDIAKARELVTKAYNEAKANGDYEDGQVITIQFSRSSDNEFSKLLISTVESTVLEILKGTPLEGKFKIEILLSDDWNGKMISGEAQMSFSGGGGGTMDPFSLMQFNTNPGRSYGIDYRDYDVTVDIDGEKTTMNCVEWVSELVDGKYRMADTDLKARILAAVEKVVLEQYAAIPVQSSSSQKLMSMRTSTQLDHYVPIIGYGEVYFSMTDAEWDEYVESQGGELDYK